MSVDEMSVDELSWNLKYTDLPETHVFIPLVIESLEPITEMEFPQALGQSMSDATCDPVR